jgi:hypothetical protein
MFGSGVNDNAKDARIGVGGKIIFSLAGLLFTGVGVLLLWFCVRDTIAGMKTLAWRETECVIAASSVRQNSPEGRSTGDFSFEVKYRYTFDGQQFTSDQYQRNPSTMDDYGEAARLVEKYPSGSSAICYVNPASPGQALLVRYNLFSLLFLLLPLPFVAFGGVAFYAAWGTKSPGRLAEEPISDQAAPGKSRWVWIPLYSLFLLAGAAGFYFVSVRPAFKMAGARGWPAVPCVVISSELKSHGSTCSINILYSYEFKGRVFKSNAYDLMGGSSSGYDEKEAVVGRHPPDSKTVCYVNPDEPTEAVLERGFSPVMFWGVIPLIFLLIGAYGLGYTVRPLLQKASNAGGAAVAIPAFSASESTEMVPLKPAFPPWLKLLVMGFICLFVNGIVSVFVVQAIKGWRSDHAEWNWIGWIMRILVSLFLIPFVAIGLKLFGTVFNCFLALFNPRPRLAVTPGAVRLGGKFQVQWSLTGRAGALQNLSLRLEGIEEASSGSGRSRDTATSVFANLEIAKATTPREIRSGQASVTIPAGLVPSFAGKNNAINWSIQVHGKTAWGPDVKEEFPVTVLPCAPAARRSL